ncbi:hypothetical protein [Thermococcus sp. JCM 11816]|uniref:hypothetical protein n=1 Tax=Thermococcus sp. (strain JCM 11816 / KS-1) TaxID=1295125 RepID=UPI0006D1FFC9
MGKYLMKLIILIPYLLSMITIFYEYSPLISPLFNDRLHFMYGDFSTIVNPYSGIDRFNQTFYVFNQHLGSQALDVNRALLLESLSALSKIFNLTDSQVQSLIILLSVSLGLYGIGSLIKLFIDDTRAQYILFFGLSIFYYLNLWSTERIGHFWIWTGYAVFPLLLYFGMSFISRGDKRNVILYAIIFAIYGIIPHTFIYISMLTFMLVLIGICKGGDFKRATSFVVGVFGLYFLLNSGIFLVLFNSASGGGIPFLLLSKNFRCYQGMEL